MDYNTPLAEGPLDCNTPLAEGPLRSCTLISRHLSKFATQQKIQRTDNFVRNMRPGTKFTGRIAEGWQLATHASFIEKLNCNGEPIDFFFINAAPNHGMDTFYNTVLKPAWPDVPPFKTFSSVLAGKGKKPNNLIGFFARPCLRPPRTRPRIMPPCARARAYPRARRPARSRARRPAARAHPPPLPRRPARPRPCSAT